MPANMARRQRCASRWSSGRAMVTLAVHDDGHGFPPQAIRPAAGRGEGLPGMRERAALLGGALSVESAPGAGTRIAAAIPLPEIEPEVGEVKQ